MLGDTPRPGWQTWVAWIAIGIIAIVGLLMFELLKF